MSHDLENFGKLFTGTWKYDRDDPGYEDSLRALKFPEADIAIILQMKPTIKMEKRGDEAFFGAELMPGHSEEKLFTLGEPFEMKSEDDPPLFHNKELFTMEGDKLKMESWSLLTGPQKIDTLTYVIRKGDEIHMPMSAIDGKGPAANRIFKKA